MEIFHARDPFVPTEEMKKNIPLPASEEELQTRQAELNAVSSAETKYPANTTGNESDK
jgi:uncharacterized membrane protein YgaE (UPF0421/DUF939 family)